MKVDSLEDANAMIDDMAASGSLDPALLLTMAKAYNGVKDTDKTKEEVKDIMAHLYFRVRQKTSTINPLTLNSLKLKP